MRKICNNVKAIIQYLSQRLNKSRNNVRYGFTHLEVSCPGDVDDGGLLGVLLVLLARLLGDERPEAVQVDGGAVLRRHVRVHVEVPHANLNGRKK